MAIARDEAFSFLYPANLEVLSDLGARSVFLPRRWLMNRSRKRTLDRLPGGYPELHLDTLAYVRRHEGFNAQAHIAAGRPVYAECGAHAVLARLRLTDRVGKRAAMLGLMPGDAKLQKRLKRDRAASG
ncbi:hypothetical protein ACTMU2_11630 [Cupriavidus basilensis]